MPAILEPVARDARPADAKALAAFPKRARAAPWRAPRVDHRLMLFESNTGELVAVAAHEIGDLTCAAGAPQTNTHIDL